MNKLELVKRQKIYRRHETTQFRYAHLFFFLFVCLSVKPSWKMFNSISIVCSDYYDKWNFLLSFQWKRLTFLRLSSSDILCYGQLEWLRKECVTFKGESLNTFATSFGGFHFKFFHHPRLWYTSNKNSSSQHSSVKMRRNHMCAFWWNIWGKEMCSWRKFKTCYMRWLWLVCFLSIDPVFSIELNRDECHDNVHVHSWNLDLIQSKNIIRCWRN